MAVSPVWVDLTDELHPPERAPATEAPPVLEVFSDFLLLERLNVGGMAEVFAARPRAAANAEQVMAIKRILPSIARDNQYIAMFIDEGRIGLILDHPNIVRTQQFGCCRDRYFIAMEYVAGADLRSLLQRMRRLGHLIPVASAVEIAAQVCLGLDFAHRRRDEQGAELGIVHRDVSPQNILVSYQGEVKIIDFGIAKSTQRCQCATQAGVLKGKFGYMSPEQVRLLPVDRRSDVFSVGALLFELLTGRKLFAGDADRSTLEQVERAEVPSLRALNPEIPPELEAVVRRALAREPGERYSWASEFRSDLVALLSAEERENSAAQLAALMAQSFPDGLIREEKRRRRYAGAVAPLESQAESLAGPPSDNRAQLHRRPLEETVLTPAPRADTAPRPPERRRGRPLVRGLSLAGAALLVVAATPLVPQELYWAVAPRFEAAPPEPVSSPLEPAVSNAEPGAAAGMQNDFERPVRPSAPTALRGRPPPPARAKRTVRTAEAQTSTPMGRLACSSVPPHAEVFVNGEFTGRRTPVTFAQPLQLPAGSHLVVLKLGERRSAPIQVTIVKNQLLPLRNVAVDKTDPDI